MVEHLVVPIKWRQDKLVYQSYVVKLGRQVHNSWWQDVFAVRKRSVRSQRLGVVCSLPVIHMLPYALPHEVSFTASSHVKQVWNSHQQNVFTVNVDGVACVRIVGSVDRARITTVGVVVNAVQQQGVCCCPSLALGRNA